MFLKSLGWRSKVLQNDLHEALIHLKMYGLYA